MSIFSPILVLPSAIKQTATIIFLHGLGDSGASWSEILPSFTPPYSKLVIPNAPVRPVTLYQGTEMRSWFDLRPLDQPKDEQGIKNASVHIQKLIQEEIDHGTPPSRIVLGGFSQGGALALYTGLTGNLTLGGILALSTWLPLDKILDWKTVQKPKIFQTHGDKDEMIALDRATKNAEILSTHIPNYKFKMYPGLNHSINSEIEVADIKEFLRSEAIPPIVETDLQKSSKL